MPIPFDRILGTAITALIIGLTGVGQCQEGCSIYINSDPTGADIIFDSTRLDVKTPIRLDDLPEGNHIIRLEKEGLEGERAVTLQPNVMSRIDVTLTASQAILIITSDPAGAEVQIDGQPRGQTPYRYVAPGFRTYSVEVRSIGYLPESREIDIHKVGTTEVHLDLQRYGDLRVESDPVGAEVYIDGAFQGRTPGDFRLAEGTHSVVLQRVNNKPYQEEVEITAGHPMDLVATLIPENGELTVLGLPDGSQVSLDDTLLAVTPIDRHTVPAGPHWLHYRSDGFEPLKEPIWIEVPERQETVVEITVQTKTRWNAIWRSLLFPGVGQLYSEQSMKGLAFLGMGALCVSTTVLLQYQTEDAEENYRIAQDRYTKEISPYGIDAARQSMIAKHDLYRNKIDRRNTLMITTATLWILGCLDQILFSPTPWKRKVQTTTRLSFQGTIDQDHVGVQLALQW